MSTHIPITFFLSPFTNHKIDRSGTLMRGPSFRLFHGKTQIPEGVPPPKAEVDGDELLHKLRQPA